ncbi:MAG: PIN domain-containing protein [Gammaproteobacteria bacterium]|nr:PIN domain-containing protein [Gammaproteobacteria bacterium]
MYLIDSSVWIDFLNDKTSDKVDQCIALEQSGLTMLIYMEVLQGANSQKKFNLYQSYLSEQPFYNFKDIIKSYEQAAKIYFDCRQKGITIRSTIDCLVAQCAIENNLILLHNDKDFKQIAKIYPLLRLQQI